MTRQSGGARRQQTPRSDHRSGYLALAAVLLAAVLLAIAAVRTSTAPGGSEAPRKAAVSSVARSCPAFATSGSADQSIATAGIELPTSGSGGERTATELPGGDSIDGLVPQDTGAWATDDVSSAKARAVLLSASGGSAPGTVAFGASTADDELGGGLVVSDCPAPRRDHWFVGAGSSTEHQSTLVLTNPTESPAVVDLELYGDEGPVEAVGGSGVEVDPGSVKRIEVQDLAAGESELAVHAVVDRGSVSISTLDGGADGSEWIPNASSPSRDPVIAGIGAGDRTLLVANPGERTATADVRVIGKDGTFTATKLDEVEVEPGAVATAELPDDVDDKAIGVALSSDLPVTASVRTASDGDIAYAAAAEPLTGTAAMPLEVGDIGASDSELLLSGAPDDDATVRLTGYDEDGEKLASQDVTVPAGTTVATEPSDAEIGSAGDLAYLTAEPDDVPVHASAVYGTGDGTSAMPLTPAPSQVPAPVAEPGS